MAIARLLLKAPRIVVLDEATAHLDSESEAAVQRALDTALEGRTSLVIAHRLSTVRNAARILVFEQGRVVENGTYDELVARGGTFATLAKAQFLTIGETVASVTPATEPTAGADERAENNVAEPTATAGVGAQSADKVELPPNRITGDAAE